MLSRPRQDRGPRRRAAATAACRFRREAHVPKGGPTAATAAAAATSCCVATTRCATCSPSGAARTSEAQRGGHGEGAQRHGADGDDAGRRASRPGTQVERWDGTRYDLVAPGPGGRRRARRHRRARQQALRDADAPGAAARRARAAGRGGLVELHLKLLADVGLVGLPNAGKSSLLARLTRAQPKIADYPFTTLEPVLGTLEADDRQLVHRRHPGADRGRERRRRPRPRLPRARRAHAAARPRARPRAARRLRPGRQPRRRSSASWPRTTRGWRRCRAILALSKADLVTPGGGRGGRGATWRERLGEDVPGAA